MAPTDLPCIVDRRLIPFADRISGYRKVAHDFDELPTARSCGHYTDLKGLAGICESRELVATNPCYFSGTEEFLYYACMVISAIRACPEFTDPEKSRAEAWVRRLLFDRFPMNVLVVSFSIVPDSLAGWRTYAPSNGYLLGFSSRSLKALIDEKVSFIGRVYYNYALQEQKVLNKIKMVLPYVSEAAVERGSEADRLIERKIYMPLAKLFGFLKHPALSEEHEFRLVFLSRQPAQGQGAGNGAPLLSGRISLEPYLAKTGSTIFDWVQCGPSRTDFVEQMSAADRVLRGHGLTCPSYRRTVIPYQGP